MGVGVGGGLLSIYMRNTSLGASHVGSLGPGYLDIRVL